MKNPPKFLFVLYCLAMWAVLPSSCIHAQDTNADILTVKSRLFNSFCTSDGLYLAQIWLSSQNTNGSWSNIDYNNQSEGTWQPVAHLYQLRNMAMAYQYPSNTLYHSSALLRGITNGLNYWFWRKPTSTNSWYNNIGQQGPLSEVLVLMEKSLPPDLISTGTTYFYHDNIETATGANLTWYMREIIIGGLLRGNASDISYGFMKIANGISTNQVEGVQPDGSFHQHGAQLYNSGYACPFFSDSLLYAELAQGTVFAFADEKIRILSNCLLNGSRLMVRGVLAEYSANGRCITRKGASCSAKNLLNACQRLSRFDPANQNLYQELSSVIVGGERTWSYIGNKHFWNSDVMVQQRTNYYFSVKMNSLRTIGTEIGDGENLKGGWLPFGAMFVLQNGNEYRDIFPVWDWARIPGVTAPNFSATSLIWNCSQFVGGVSDGVYGAATMDLSALTTHGKKSWFFFDDECVALGAGIRSADNAAVGTTLDQCLLKGDVVVNNTSIPVGDHNIAAASWVYHNGIGYVFPQPTNIMLRNDIQQGTWQSINAMYDTNIVQTNVFKLWMDHGLKPVNANYQYIVNACSNSYQVGAYAANLPIKVLANTTNLQAVTHSILGISEMVFYKAGTIIISTNSSVSVDQPCMVMLRNLDRSIKVACSNPSGTAISLNVTVTVSNTTKIVHFDLPGGGLGGSTVVKTIALVDPVPRLYRVVSY